MQWQTVISSFKKQELIHLSLWAAYYYNHGLHYPNNFQIILPTNVGAAFEIPHSHSIGLAYESDQPQENHQSKSHQGKNDLFVNAHVFCTKY